MLNVENLSVSYGAIKAVRNISFHVAEGEIVSIIGNNGAGKSSTLRALTGIVTPASGSIKLFDREIAGTKAHKVSGLGMSMVPEGRGIYTRMTVLENLEMGAFNRRDKEGVKRDMEKVFDLFPVLGAAQAEGRQPVRRRAADAGCREGHDAVAQNPAAGRAVPGACAPGNRGHL